MAMNHAGGVPAKTANSESRRKPRPTRPYWILRYAWTLAACMTVVGSSGCTALQGVRDVVQYNDVCDDFVVGWRNYVWANQAWHAAKPAYGGQTYLKDFGEGFRAGYRDVAAGGHGCPPPLPPRKYWSWKYQSPEGQGKVAAWFEGYPHGAATAEQECAGNWRQIQVSHVIEDQYSPEFEQAQIPRADGTPFPQPAPGAMLDPRIRPTEMLPGPSGMPPGQMPPQPAPRGGSPLNDGTMQGFPRSPVMMPNRGPILQAGHRITDELGDQRFSGRRLPAPSGFAGGPRDGVAPYR